MTREREKELAMEAKKEDLEDLVAGALRIAKKWVAKSNTGPTTSDTAAIVAAALIKSALNCERNSIDLRNALREVGSEKVNNK